MKTGVPKGFLSLPKLLHSLLMKILESTANSYTTYIILDIFLVRGPLPDGLLPEGKWGKYI